MKLFIRMLSFILCAVLLLTVSACSDGEIQSVSSVTERTESTAESQPEPQPQTSETAASVPVSEPSASVAQSQPESQPQPPAPAKEQVKPYTPPQTAGPDARPVETSFTQEQIDTLLSLDNTMQGWGQGLNKDEHNRPVSSVSHQSLYGGYDAFFICEYEPKIRLTFDEGYENGYTSVILDTLRDKGVSAVFFVTLPYVKANMSLVKRMIDEGHVVGNHSTKHLSFPSMSIDEAYKDIMTLHNYMKDNFGYTMTLFRFPMGQFSIRTLSMLQMLGYRSLFWSFAYQDWITDSQPEQGAALTRITNDAHNGGLYLLHAVSSTNAAILGSLIDNWRARGFEVAKFE